MAVLPKRRKISAQDEENMPKVKVNALRNFENIIVDEEILSRANQNLDNLMATSGLSGDSTIRDYLKRVLDETIENKLEGVSVRSAKIFAHTINTIIARMPLRYSAFNFVPILAPI